VANSNYADCTHGNDDPLTRALEDNQGTLGKLEKICQELKIAMPFRNPDRIIFSFDGRY